MQPDVTCLLPGCDTPVDYGWCAKHVRSLDAKWARRWWARRQKEQRRAA